MYDSHCLSKFFFLVRFLLIQKQTKKSLISWRWVVDRGEHSQDRQSLILREWRNHFKHLKIKFVKCANFVVLKFVRKIKRISCDSKMHDSEQKNRRVNKQTSRSRGKNTRDRHETKTMCCVAFSSIYDKTTRRWDSISYTSHDSQILNKIPQPSFSGFRKKFILGINAEHSGNCSPFKT